MAKLQTRYVCQSCAYESPRWVGKCPNCSGWNTFVEEVVARPAGGKAAARAHAPSKAVALAGVALTHEERLSSGIAEFDRVMGGGIVLGSVTLLGGDPGVGKSTLMLQLAAALPGKSILYVSGEESERQIKMRAVRLAPQLPQDLYLDFVTRNARTLCATNTSRDRVAYTVSGAVEGPATHAGKNIFASTTATVTKLRHCTRIDDE